MGANMTKRMPGFFDVEERLRELSAKGDDLERVQALVDFEIFRPALEAAVSRADRSKGGRPPFDHVLMFKVLILQAMHSLSDERCEYLIKDRLSFMRFLGISVADAVPEFVEGTHVVYAFAVDGSHVDAAHSETEQVGSPVIGPIAAAFVFSKRRLFSRDVKCRIKPSTVEEDVNVTTSISPARSLFFASTAARRALTVR